MVAIDADVGELRLDNADSTDGPAIACIHADGLATGHASFRATPYGWDEWVGEFALHRVARRDGVVVGWAGVTPTSDRCTYAGVGEVSVYVDAAWAGRGVGHALLHAVIGAAEAAGYWTLMAQLFPENVASLRLHEKAGFRLVGRRERLGRMGHGPMQGCWRDVLLLERRSATVGVE